VKGLSELLKRIVRLERAPIGLPSGESDIACALAALTEQPEVVAFSERVVAALEASGIAFEEERQGYLWLISNRPDLVEQAALITESQAGLLDKPPVANGHHVNGLKELPP
jgi:hypothetical protein